MSTEKQNIDWENLGFNVHPTRSMWKGECRIGQPWSNGQLIPYGKIEMFPASCVSASRARKYNLRAVD